MASTWSSQLIMAIFLVGSFSSFSSFPAALPLPTSTISAAPALLPIDPPLSSPPALSPDITPLFPSPAASGSGPSPSESSSLPTIPSTPSPPNPDEIAASGPTMGSSPSGSFPAPSSVALPLAAYLNLIIFLGLMAFWVMQLSIV